ncbi:LDCC motif putative metal-binding protein [Tissierella sp.]|nr:LDCC motif putative metal-binding protein [Tissierella sp.]MDR7854989.1 LDCC motif putative metal-binding protein [Tissierella sp.]
MKNIIKSWLKKLEESNKESFGSKPLDCCTIGRDKKAAKPVNASSNKK